MIRDRSTFGAGVAACFAGGLLLGAGAWASGAHAMGAAIASLMFAVAGVRMVVEAAR